MQPLLGNDTIRLGHAAQHNQWKYCWELFSMWSVPIATLCNNRRTVASTVFCWVHSEAISCRPKGQVSLVERWTPACGCMSQEARKLKDLGDNQWRQSRLRRLSMCCNQLQSVLISDSTTVLVVTSFESPVNLITNPNPIYSHLSCDNLYPLKSYGQRKSNLSLLASFLQDLNERLSWFV
jgi:hypothetical protein